jgi:hypothetical protein
MEPEVQLIIHKSSTLASTPSQFNFSTILSICAMGFTDNTVYIFHVSGMHVNFAVHLIHIHSITITD